MISALSDAFACCSTCARSACPASRAALPDTKVWREAEVLPASGVMSVSAPSTVTSATGTPKACAKICTITVFDPCPISIAP